MPFTSLLLRLLLCVTLALNGISGASAAARMAAGHSQLPSMAMQAGPGVATDTAAMDQPMPPCHAHGEVSMSMSIDNPPGIAHHAVTPGGPAAPDHRQCCDTSSCQCACAHQCAATMATSLVILPAAPATVAGRAPDASHQPPALPHLIRPPIV